MNKAPHNRGASGKTTYYSTSKKVSLREEIINFLALNTPESPLEEKAVTKRRREIVSAEMALAHLTHEGLAPIFSPLDFQALQTRGLQ